MVNRLTLYAAIAVLLMALSGGAVWHWMSGRVDRLEADLLVAQSSLKATNNALNAKDAQLKSLDRKYTKQSKELQDALKDNPNWATGRVPDAVYDSLFGSH